jgi:hypothetical protein
MMFAPCENKNCETAATMPRRSGQEINKRAVLGRDGSDMRGSGYQSRPALGFLERISRCDALVNVVAYDAYVNFRPYFLLCLVFLLVACPGQNRQSVVPSNPVVDSGSKTDPKPVDPAPVDPKPVDPAPVDPKPVDPKPVDPVLVPSYKYTLETSAPILRGGESITIKIKLERINGFAQPVKLTLSEPPPEVTAPDVEIPANATEANMVVSASKSVSNYSQVQLVVKSQTAAGTHLETTKIEIAWYLRPELGISSQDARSAFFAGESVTFTASVNFDYARKGLNWEFKDNDGNSLNLQRLVLSEFLDWDASSGRYTTKITVKAPASYQRFYIRASIKNDPDAFSQLESLVKSKVRELQSFVLTNTYRVSANCVQVDGSSVCGTDSSRYSSEAQALGGLNRIDAFSIALPSKVIPDYEAQGINLNVTWTLVQGAGTVRQVNGMWYYSASYPQNPQTLPSGLVEFEVKSVEDPTQAFRVGITVEYLNLQLPNSNDPPWIFWPEGEISDQAVFRIGARLANRPYADGVTYHLEWSATSSQGNAGQVAQNGCYTAPQLPAGGSRSVTITAKLLEVPGMQLQKTFVVRQGIANTRGTQCADYLFLDSNGFLQ